MTTLLFLTRTFHYLLCAAVNGTLSNWHWEILRRTNVKWDWMLRWGIGLNKSVLIYTATQVTLIRSFIPDEMLTWDIFTYFEQTCKNNYDVSLARYVDLVDTLNSTERG